MKRVYPIVRPSSLRLVPCFLFYGLLALAPTGKQTAVIPGSSLDALKGSRPLPALRRARTSAAAGSGSGGSSMKMAASSSGFFSAIQSVGAGGSGISSGSVSKSAMTGQAGGHRLAAKGSKGCSARLSDTIKVLGGRPVTHFVSPAMFPVLFHTRVDRERLSSC